MEYEIIDISQDENNIRVVIEHSDGRREGFGFPLGEGWETEKDGKLRCIIEVERVLKEREERQLKVPKFDIGALRKKFVGKKLKIKAAVKNEIPKTGMELA